MIKVLFFASLRQQLDTAEYQLQNFSGSVQDLRAHLAELFPSWEVHLQADNVQAAINQEMVTGNAAVADGDEVAFFPPVTGG
ncbi:molybdopterin synthase sulfur carrier subunit [Microbulbifer aestuariivivens]|uniref:Molybdopterin synthase sulfur carrier subunit n=1 Tax=Microbulbifer aestuariivivens TaxID=1908308 RepID=A0ABP9WKP4_9GAMM